VQVANSPRRTISMSKKMLITSAAEGKSDLGSRAKRDRKGFGSRCAMPATKKVLHGKLISRFTSRPARRRLWLFEVAHRTRE